MLDRIYVPNDYTTHRFESYLIVREPDECWGWTGTMASGAPMFSGGGGPIKGSVSARKYSWVLYRGPLARNRRVRKGLECTDQCCNPAHLLAYAIKTDKHRRTPQPGFHRPLRRDSHRARYTELRELLSQRNLTPEDRNLLIKEKIILREELVKRGYLSPYLKTCGNGHSYTIANTVYTSLGDRTCRECRKTWGKRGNKVRTAKGKRPPKKKKIIIPWTETARSYLESL